MSTNNDPTSVFAQALAQAQAQQAFILGQTALTNGIPQNPLLGLQQNGIPSAQLLSALPQFQQGPNIAVQMAMGQIMTDAFKMLVPVGSSPNDEELLVQALAESEGKGQTYRVALDALHGVNNHAANLWKDYFLENHSRIESMVQSRKLGRPINGVKKPSFGERRSNESQPQSYATSSRIDSGSKSREISYQTSASPLASSSTKTKKHSAERESPRRGRSPSRDSSSQPPSRSPTPPTEVVLRRDGRYQYTEEENEYFLRYIKYRLQQDPNSKKADICDGLYQKMPHHSAISWLSHWGQIRDRVDEYCGADAFVHVRRRPRGWKYIPANNSSDYEHDSSDQDVSEEGEEDDTDSDDDRQNMSGAGGPMTDADKRVMARYVASFSDWDSLTNRDKWGAFEQMYPQRNHKAWAELFRMRQNEIKKLVQKYTRRKEKFRKQVGRPTWASNSGLSKRPRSESSEMEPSNLKRQKDGTGR